MNMNFKIDTKQIKIPPRSYGEKKSGYAELFDQLTVGSSFHLKTDEKRDHERYLMGFKHWKKKNIKAKKLQLISRQTDAGFRFWMTAGEK